MQVLSFQHFPVPAESRRQLAEPSEELGKQQRDRGRIHPEGIATTPTKS